MINIYGTVFSPFCMCIKHGLRVFNNRALWKLFVPKWEQVRQYWGKLHNDELENLSASARVIWLIKSRRVRWVGHVACMGEKRTTYWVLGNLKARNHFEDIGLDGRKTVKWIWKEEGGRAWTDWSASGQGQVAGSCEQGVNPQVPICAGDFLTSCRPVSFFRCLLVTWQSIITH
jgi:hypothetical protein